MGQYIVQRDDILSGIAQKLLGDGNRWTEIAKLNNLASPNLLFVGQILKIPNLARPLKPIITAPAQIYGPPTPVYGPQLPATLALARGYVFVVIEQLPEVGTGKIIRKVAVIPRDFAFQAKNPRGNLSLAEHVLDLNGSMSQYLSGSNRPMGAATIEGKPVLMDVAKIKKAGGQIYSVKEVVADLRRFYALNPGQSNIPKLIETIEKIEGEVLIQGGTPSGSGTRPGTAHNAYIKSAERLYQELKSRKITRDQFINELAKLEKAYSKAKVVGRIGRVLGVFGVIVTAADVARATQRSIDQRSLKPLGAETIRQVGGWGMAIAGSKIGFGLGALFGIETGPGAIVTGGIGAVVFGAAGYFGADWVADHISPN